MSTTNNPNDPEGTIPVEHAIKLTANWRSHLASSGQAFVGRSFLIPIISFTNIPLHNPNAEGVRAYIGLEDHADPTTAKLLLVPVVNGEDVPHLVAEDGSNQSNVFDLTGFCPPYCDVSSILNS